MFPQTPVVAEERVCCGHLPQQSLVHNVPHTCQTLHAQPLVCSLLPESGDVCCHVGSNASVLLSHRRCNFLEGNAVSDGGPHARAAIICRRISGCQSGQPIGVHACHTPLSCSPPGSMQPLQDDCGKACASNEAMSEAMTEASHSSV